MNPSSATARKTVLVSILLLYGIAVYRSKTPENDVNLFKRVWGISVIGAFLSLAADFIPTIAGPFAILTVLGSLTRGGDAAINNALSGLSSKAGAVTPSVNPAVNPKAAGPVQPGATGAASTVGTIASTASTLGGF